MNVPADTQLLGTTSGDTTNYRHSNYRHLIKLHNAATVGHYTMMDDNCSGRRVNICCVTL